MKAGWVHELKLHTFSSAKGTRFVVMAKVNLMLKGQCDSMKPFKYCYTQ